MIPTAAMSSATDSVEAAEPKKRGYAVQVTVRTKISHTWLASHTGAIESCASSRIGSLRPDTSCQNPAPKSAPPSTPYRARPASAKASGRTSSMAQAGTRARGEAASRRRTQATPTATPAYTSARVAYPTGIPPAPVTAWEVRIVP